MTDSPSKKRRPHVALALNLALAAGTLVLLLAVVEGVLRATGYRFALHPEAVQFGQGTEADLLRVFEADDDLLWVKRGYDELLERLRVERPPIVLLGDSCTHLGSWDEALERRGRRHRRLRGVGVRPLTGNLAVAGWSSFQGRRQLERDVAAIGPVAVTIYFGWNDHWIGFGIEDRVLARVRRWFSSRWSGLRLVQLAAQATVALHARDDPARPRVPLDAFRDNVRAMVAEARAMDAVPMLLTAPTSHRPGRLPAALAPRYVSSIDRLVPLHRAYVEAVRDVADETGAPLCDLYASFAALPPAALDAAFQDDGIHPSAEGDERVAALVDECFERAGVWDAIGALE